MSKQRPGTHPAPEDMAAMIDGNLDSGERAAFVQHLSECEECREALAEYARASHGREDSGRSSGRVPALVWMSVAATLTMATVASVLVLRRPSSIADVAPANGTANSPAPAASPAPTPAPAPAPAPPTTKQAVPEDLTTRRSGTRELDGRTFRLVAGEWVDSSYDPLALLPVEHIEPPDRAATLARIPGLRPYDALGPRFVVVHAGTVYRFGPR